MRFSSLVAALCSVAACVSALDPISVTGNKLYRPDGSQFLIKGVAYQLQPSDPLIDTDQCGRDADLMKDLGANTIRVYHVDPTADHDGCISTFADAGIYVLIDLDTFDTYILPDHLTWNQDLFDRYAAVMDAFHQYDSVLGFYIGNENIAKKEDSPVAPYLKAAVTDMKSYRDRRGYRDIPVGYSAADIMQLRPMLQDYLTCGGNSSQIVDFFSVNSYSWCDPSSYHASTYDQLEEFAKNFPVPIFFSETGCNVPGPRKFDDQDAIFGDMMIQDWSGAIIYEWIEEENNYGLVTYGHAENGSFLRSGTPQKYNNDFDTLKKKWSSLNPTGVSKSDYDPDSVSTRECPTSTQGGWWEVDGNVALPTLGANLLVTVTPTPETSRFSHSPTKTKSTGSGKPGETAMGSSGGSENGSAPINYQAAVLRASFVAAAVSLVFLL